MPQYLFHLTKPVGTQTGAQECPHRQILAGREACLSRRRVETLPKHIRVTRPDIQWDNVANWVSQTLQNEQQ
jgi:hypothetical protein